MVAVQLSVLHRYIYALTHLARFPHDDMCGRIVRGCWLFTNMDELFEFANNNPVPRDPESRTLDAYYICMLEYAPAHRLFIPAIIDEPDGGFVPDPGFWRVDSIGEEDLLSITNDYPSATIDQIRTMAPNHELKLYFLSKDIKFPASYGDEEGFIHIYDTLVVGFEPPTEEQLLRVVHDIPTSSDGKLGIDVPVRITFQYDESEEKWIKL